MARAASAPELVYYRTPGKWSDLFAAFLVPPVIYTAKVNQTFSTRDQVLVITYDTGSGTLANVLPDMEVWIGTAPGKNDKGICRLRDKDATHFYVSGTSEIAFADNDDVTILAAYGVWARPARVAADGTTYMDETLYTDQHLNWDPMPNMGAHQILELTGATVNAVFNASTSFCTGSSISTWGWSCATASASSGTTTNAPTFTFNTTGWHIVYLTVTGANGKSFFGVRYVYVWNDAHPPAAAEITDAGHCDVNTGGWSIGLRLTSAADLATVYERAMVILFAKDHYGDAQVNIGPVAGSENIRFIGWINSEVQMSSSEVPSVSFTAANAAFWLSKIPSWTDGVEITGSTPTGWTNAQSLTIDIGLYHYLRWRTTMTRVMDVTLTGDARITQELSSSAQTLWAQMQEITWSKIYARPGVNYLNQFSCQVHPALVPTGSRTAPTVMDITDADILDDFDFDRIIVPDVGVVDMSGIQVTAFNVGSAYFALAPGHALPHYGAWDIQPNLTVASQAQIIILAGLYRSMRNNPYPVIQMKFAAAIALLDVFPNMKCTVSGGISNIRGTTYTGGLFPNAISLIQDPETGYVHTEVTWEAETFESQAIQGDFAGSGDTSQPPNPSFPPLPDIPVLLPGSGGAGSDNGPTVVVVHDTAQGYLYSTNFNETGGVKPDWTFMNSGLTTARKQNSNFFFMTPSGACYCGYRHRDQQFSPYSHFLARAPSLGSAWTILYDENNLSPGSGTRWGVLGAGYSTLYPDVVAAVIENGITDGTPRLHVITNGVAVIGGIAASSGFTWNFWITYGLGKWLATTLGGAETFPLSGSAATGIAGMGSLGAPHIRASSTGRTYHDLDLTDTFMVGDNNLTTHNNVVPSAPLSFNDNFDGPLWWDVNPTGQYMMSRFDTGARGRSSDYGTTWGLIPVLPFGNWWFRYAGGTNRFLAVGGTSIRLTLDFGDTWIDKMSTGMTSLIPIPSLNNAWVQSY